MRLTPQAHLLIVIAREQDLWCLHEESGQCFEPDELLERWEQGMGPFDGFTHITAELRLQSLIADAMLAQEKVHDFQLRRRARRVGN